MKTPTRRLDFGEMGYTTEKGEPLWVDIPRSMKEGQVSAFAESASDSKPHEISVKVLETVVDWNLDDDDGKVLPLPRKVAGDAKSDVVAQVPWEIISTIVETFTGATAVDEATKGF